MDWSWTICDWCESSRRRGSFTTAAETLHYSQGGVSRRVAQLERRLGGSLFTRLPRGVRPTVLGEVLLAHAQDLLRRVDALAEDLKP